MMEKQTLQPNATVTSALDAPFNGPCSFFFYYKTTLRYFYFKVLIKLQGKLELS